MVQLIRTDKINPSNSVIPQWKWASFAKHNYLEKELKKSTYLLAKCFLELFNQSRLHLGEAKHLDEERNTQMFSSIWMFLTICFSWLLTNDPAVLQKMVYGMPCLTEERSNILRKIWCRPVCTNTRSLSLIEAMTWPRKWEQLHVFLKLFFCSEHQTAKDFRLIVLFTISLHVGSLILFIMCSHLNQ